MGFQSGFVPGTIGVTSVFTFTTIFTTSSFGYVECVGKAPALFYLTSSAIG
jgi:hypothetical protein